MIRHYAIVFHVVNHIICLKKGGIGG